MRVSLRTMCFLGVLLVLVTGCSTQSPTGPSHTTVDGTSLIPSRSASAQVAGRSSTSLSAPQGADSSGTSTTVSALGGPQPRPQTWADSELFELKETA